MIELAVPLLDEAGGARIEVVVLRLGVPVTVVTAAQSDQAWEA